MNRKKHILILLILIMACKKPYNPPAISSPGSYLVVEGVINTGSDSTVFKLSRTVSVVIGASAANPETGATVTVESNTNKSYPLKEITKGYYAAVGLNLDNTLQYRLRIQTLGKDQYLSDFVTVQVTPPVDSVGYTISNNAVNLYVNTHDPNNNTHYYRWDYVETWQFHSEYQSQYISNGKAIVPRTPAQNIYYCFGNDVSSSIIIGSSAKLKQDVIYQNPLTQVVSTSEKLETKYSILVRQYALSSDAYSFWLNVKTNTEQLGSIFDAQPSGAPTNLHDVTNPATPVIGYVSACTVQSKRIFISENQLPQLPSWLPVYPYNCELDTNYYSTPHSGYNAVAGMLIPLPNDDIPTNPFSAPGAASPAGFLSSGVDCVDCTIRGTVTQPGFWK
jgi:hypothetical protein